MNEIYISDITLKLLDEYIDELMSGPGILMPECHDSAIRKLLESQLNSKDKK